MQTKLTINHQEIQSWAEKLNAKPQLIDHQDSTGDKVGIRIDIPGHSDETYNIRAEEQEATWEKFFEIFDREELALEYYEDTTNAKFPYRFVKR
jgi:hypothetical protein